MKGNRGSAAVIAIIFMMFLLIIGIGFLPLMNSELKHASMDMDEQKAWYAAEAGIKYVKAYQTDAASITAILGKSINLSNDSNTAAYKLTMKNKADNTPVTSDPESDKTYIINSEGIYNGVKKIITGEFVFAKSSSSSGGESGGGESGGTAYTLEQIIAAGNSLDIADSVKDKGSLGASDVVSGGNLNNNSKHINASKDATLGAKLKTEINSKVFLESSYAPFTESWNIDDAAGISNWQFSDAGKYKLTGNLNNCSGDNFNISSTALLYRPGQFKVSGSSINVGETGYFILITNNETEINLSGSGDFQGNIIILSSSKITVRNMSTGNKTNVFIMGNQQVQITGSSISKCFISGKEDVTILDSDIEGQIQSAKSVKLQGKTNIKGDKTVLALFSNLLNDLGVFD